MSLDQIIPPEVINDEFHHALKEIAMRNDISEILEIGSSSGGGSTSAIVDGINIKNTVTKLYCMEISRPRFLNLVNTYKDKKFVIPYNISSVGLNEFPSKEEVSYFYRNTKTKLNDYSEDLVLSWLEQDINYINDNCLNFPGIEFVKRCNNIKNFDFVLIDGSEFTGESELQHVWGSKVIALDDVNSFKCFAAYNRLTSSYAYRLISQNINLRAGYAIFERAC